MSVSALASTLGSAVLSLGGLRASRARAERPAAASKPASFAAPGRSVVVRAKKGKSSDDYDDYVDDYADYDDEFGSADGSGSGSGSGSFGGGGGKGKPAGGKKGAAKRQKKAKYGEDELAPIASNVSKLINQKKKKIEAGAIGSSLDIGNSLDGGDGEGFEPPLLAWKGGGTNFGDGLLSMDDGGWDVPTATADSADAAPVMIVAREKKKKETPVRPDATVEPADPAKAAKKAKTTLCKWGWTSADVDAALEATAGKTEGEIGSGQTAFNKTRQVSALDWLLLNAPEASVPVDYRNDAIKARS
jgi:hypothetical protein